MDHHLLLCRAVYRSAWSGRHRLAQAAGRSFAGPDRRRSNRYHYDHPMGLGGAFGVRGQHPLCRHHDSVDQRDGSHLRRCGRLDAVVVGAVAGRMSGGQRHFDRGQRQSGGGRFR